jgi:hypothetical protein
MGRMGSGKVLYVPIGSQVISFREVKSFIQILAEKLIFRTTFTAYTRNAIPYSS